MTVVVGRRGGIERGPVADFGSYRAVDGSMGASVGLDLDGPHAVSVVGKRGYGKSYTLGVLAEELARTRGLAPVVVDPVGVFDSLAAGVRDEDRQAVPASVLSNPSVPATALDPRSWCSLLGLSPESGAGALVWQAAGSVDTLAEMIAHVEAAEAPVVDRRAARNHLELAATWGVFDPDGLSVATLGTDAVSVLDVSGLDPAPRNAVVRAVTESLFRARVTDDLVRFPWLLVDEAHAFFDGIADDALGRVLTRGRAPGVSLVLATQRPSGLPDVALSQSDVLLAHRLTSTTDRKALRAVRPDAMDEVLDERLPEHPGGAVLVDDTTESIHAVSVRRRHTPHAGGNPSVSARFGE